MFPKVNQPSNPSVCCKSDKLYTNPSFVVVFLNPCFSPLYFKVYSDTKSIFIVKASPIKLEQIWPKNRFLKYADATIRTPNFSIRAPIFHACQAGKKTTISPILSHFHNNLHLDSKLVMMPNHQPPCCSLPCFPLYQVAPQVYTLCFQPLECLPPF